MYAAGKIPGGFFRREGRPSETAILTARLTDRPLRPSFKDGYRDEVQVVITVLSVDMANPYDIPGMNAASLATSLAGLPFEGPVGAVRLGLIGGEWVVNPTFQLIDEATFDVVVAGRRNDQGTTDILPLSAEVGLVPRAHGSSLFQRGDTQVLNVTTLGMLRMTQMIDTLDPEDTKRYIHHYNFPPFSTGEVGRIGSPRRREIGHGALAERALIPVIPPGDEFPYALPLVSDVLGSNGSTSMASVCASTLSLMDAGVPIKAPVAGIAMGMIAEGGEYVTLTDILGAEDALGDMDFKVAGTRDFVTALQLDTKVTGLPAEVLSGALKQAREARLFILDVMLRTIPEPREVLSAKAP